MPRLKRRLIKEKKYLHIMVQGINREKIFKKDIQKKEYIKLLKEYSEKYKINVIAYCVMDNHVHILVNYIDIEDIIKFMQKINTIYAIYYNKNQNRVGYVYRDRYKSQVIRDQNHFINCIIYIHNNPVKAQICNDASQYIYSSYNSFLKDKEMLRDMFFDVELYKNMHREEKIQENDYIEIKEDNEIQYNRYIEYFLKKYDISIEDVNSNNELIKEISYVLRHSYNLSYKKMESLIKVHREKIRRILLKK